MTTQVVENEFPKDQITRFCIDKKVEILDLIKKGAPRTGICKDYVKASSSLHTFLKHEQKSRDCLSWTERNMEGEEEEAEEEGIIEIAYAHQRLILTLVLWVD